LAAPKMRVSGVVLGAPNPRELAKFYSKLLGWPIADQAGPRPGQPEEDGWAILRPTDGRSAVSLAFEYEADYTPPVWPSRPGCPQIMAHVDIAVENLQEAAEWALQAGATLAEHQPRPQVRVMQDPAGHPFCLFVGRVEA